MSRLPTPGGDDGNWGTILNDYLSQSLNSDGTLKSSAVSSSGAEQTANKGQPSGYASLDSGGKVPSSQLPTDDDSIYEQTSHKDQSNGYAGLDGSGKLKTAEIPSSVITGVSVVGDGTTDDGPVINTALAAASSAGGGRVLVPYTNTGVCAINTLIVIPSGVTLVLADHVTLQRKSGFSGSLIVNHAINAGSGRDSNVGIVGGVGSTIDGGNNAAGSSNVNALHIRIAHCDGVTVKGLRGLSNTTGKYWLRIADATEVTVKDITLNTFSDGVHFTGPVARAYIENIHGITGDDTLAFATSEGSFNYAEPTGTASGDITDVHAVNISGNGSAELLKFYGVSGAKFRRITVDGLYGTVSSIASPVFGILGDADYGTYGALDIADITIRNIKVTNTTRIANIASVGSVTAQNIKVDGVVYNCTPVGSGWNGFYIGGAHTTLDGFCVENFETDQTIASFAGQAFFINGGATVTRMELRSFKLSTSASGVFLVKVDSSSTLTNLIFSQPEVSGQRSLYTNANTASSTEIWINGGQISSTDTGRVIDATNQVTLHVNDPQVNVNFGITYTNAGTLRVLGSGLNNIGSIAGVKRQAAEAVSVNCPTFACDTTILTPSANDMATNSNSGASYGAGPVVYTGSTWVNLTTGPSQGLSIERSSWVPSGAIGESIPRWQPPTNQAATQASGAMLIVGGLVIPANRTTSSGTFWSGTTALTMGSNNDGHFWYVLIRQSDNNVVAVTADQGGSVAWSATTAKTISWASTYTPSSNTAVWLGIMVNFGTGGSPTLNSFEGISLNSTPGGIRGLTPVLSGTWASTSPPMTTPLSTGSTVGSQIGTANPTNTSILPYAYIS